MGDIGSMGERIEDDPPWCLACGNMNGHGHRPGCSAISERANGAAGDNTKAGNPKDRAAIIAGRVPIGLFPDTAIIAGSMAMLEGRCKYGQYNYRIAGVLYSIYMDAAKRHLDALWNGEDIDPKSGFHHLWKAIACIAILIDAMECGVLVDDRPPPAPVAEMLERLQGEVKRIQEDLKDHDPHQWTIQDVRPSAPVPEERDDEQLRLPVVTAPPSTSATGSIEFELQRGTR